MADKLKKIKVKDIEVRIANFGLQDFICLSDIAKYKGGFFSSTSNYELA